LRKAGIDRAEIIKAHADTLIVDAGDQRANHADVIVQAGLGDLDFQPGGREVGLDQHSG
jgi:hypothetical protein